MGSGKAPQEVTMTLRAGYKPGEFFQRHLGGEGKLFLKLSKSN